MAKGQTLTNINAIRKATPEHVRDLAARLWPGSKTNVVAGVVTFTPELAAECLLWNDGNRKQKARALTEYTRKMKDGLWTLNGESIVFGASGRLLNGQHRLQACINSGRPFDSIVVFGIEDRTFSSLDQGRNRNGYDMADLKGMKYAQVIPGLVVVVDRWRRGALAGTDWRKRPDNEAIVALLDKYGEDASPSAAFGHNHSKACFMAPIPLAFVHYAFTHTDPLLADAFFEMLMSGTGLHEDDPVYHLRAILIRFRTQRARPPVEDVLAYVIKAWNHTRSGRKLKLLHYRPGQEPFPEIA